MSGGVEEILERRLLLRIEKGVRDFAQAQYLPPDVAVALRELTELRRSSPLLAAPVALHVAKLLWLRPPSRTADGLVWLERGFENQPHGAALLARIRQDAKVIEDALAGAV